MTQEGTFTHTKPYLPYMQEADNKYLIHTKKFKDETYGSPINSGFLDFKDEKFFGVTAWGIGKGTTIDAVKFLSTFVVNASGKQIYGIFDYGSYTS